MKVIFNGQVSTFDPAHPSATALAMDNCNILAAAGDDEVLEIFGHRADEIINAERKAIIPGLTDAHIHLEQYALGLQKVDCETTTRAECLHRVQEQALISPPGTWILGHGWNQNNWVEGFGSASDLDAVAPEHPVYLSAKSLHAAWSNTTALRLAHINAGTPDPLGGRIGRGLNGEPDGVLFESAMDLVKEAIPSPTSESIAAAIRNALPILWQAGITGVHDFDRKRCFSALQLLHQDKQLELRVIKSIPFEDLPLAVGLGLRTGFGDDWLRIGSIKAFADGALGPRTAAMLGPFDGEPDNQGMLMMDREEIYDRGRLAVENGLSLAIHAIGDRANHEVISALEQLRSYEASLNISPLRHRIEHVQLIHPDDASRLASAGVIASMQPIHAPSDMHMADRFWGKRAAFSYAWREQLRHGAILAFGSDAPVESPDPFWGIHAAVTRQRQDGTPSPDGWYPEQRLSVAEAIAGFTTGAAYAAGMENRLGRLSPGFLADLLILDDDPFHCDPQELYKIRPLATMIGGKWVYRRI